MYCMVIKYFDYCYDLSPQTTYLPILVLGFLLIILILGIRVISVVCRSSSQKTARIYQIPDNSEENDSSQKSKGSGSGGAVEIEESSLRFLQIVFLGACGRGETE